MNTMIEPDTRGIDALSDKLDDSVAQVQAWMFDELMAEMADQFPVAPLYGQDLEFDGQPWLTLPTMADLEQTWLMSPAVDILVQQLAAKLHGAGPDLPKFMATQRDLAAFELRWIKEREAEDAAKQHGPDSAGSGETPAVASVEGMGGGRDFPGGPENGGPVGKGRKAAGKANSRRPQKVPGK